MSISYDVSYNLEEFLNKIIYGFGFKSFPNLSGVLTKTSTNQPLHSILLFISDFILYALTGFEKYICSIAIFYSF